MGLAEPVAVVAHDAGAANLILAWLAREDAAVRPFMVGPAEGLWTARFPGRTLAGSVDDALEGAASLLTGTGWASDVEHEARRRAGRLRSAAVLDHWVNYRERFVRGGETVLPDEVWVCDAEAEVRAKAVLPGVPVVRRPAAYLDEQVAAVGPVPADGDALYVLEPARDDWGRGVPGEFQALDWFAGKRAEMGIGSVRLRPHPSEPPGKYDEWIAAHPGFALDAAPNLAVAMADAHWVIGTESMAMAVALVAGRRVASSLPPWAPPCRLPHAGIVRLAEAA